MEPERGSLLEHGLSGLAFRFHMCFFVGDTSCGDLQTRVKQALTRWDENLVVSFLVFLAFGSNLLWLRQVNSAGHWYLRVW